MFMNDKQRLAATKHAAGFQPKEFKQLLSLNPQLKQYFDKKIGLEDKKLAFVRQNRVLTDKEVKLKM